MGVGFFKEKERGNLSDLSCLVEGRMGNCASGVQSDPAQVNESRKIDAQIRTEKKALTKEIKILLLGAGDTGKST